MSGTFLTDSPAAGALSTHERDALLQRMAKLEQLCCSPGAASERVHADLATTAPQLCPDPRNQPGA